MIQAQTRRSSLLNQLFPSVISGIVLAVIGAIVFNVIATHLQPANTDAITVATYLGWAIFFFVGIGAFNGVWKWGFARRDATSAEELAIAGHDHHDQRSLRELRAPHHDWCS